MEFKTLVRTGTRAAQPLPGNAVQCFYRVDDESNIIEFSDGITWIAYSPAPSGLALVQYKLITVHATTVTFSGLDGNTDGVYLFNARILNKSGGNTKYVMRPNGATTNLSSNFSYSAVASVNQTTWALSSNTADCSNNNWINIKAQVWAKCDPSSVASIRMYQADIGIATTTPAAARAVIAGVWNESTTNIESFDWVGANADAIGAGSEIALYKYTQG